MAKLKKPPYQNWWWRRRGIDGVPDTTSPINPATLNPAEHYNELTWNTTPLEWRDVADGADRAFDTKTGGVISSTTQNSLLCYESAASSSLYWNASSLKPMSSWVVDDEYITMYFVVRWDGSITDYVLEWLGEVANTNLVLAMTTGDRVFWKFTDSGTNILQLYPVTVMSAGWQVWCFKFQNKTNDAVATFYNQQESAISVSQSTWIKSGIGDYLSVNRLFSNNPLTLKWDGALAEIILFRDNHSDNTIGRVNQFLQNKWDIGL